MGKRYGSKAAYEASRADIRAHRDKWERWYQMTDEERAKQRNKDRLEDGDEAMMTFMMLMAASMAGGADAKKAAANADLAIAELKRRFT